MATAKLVPTHDSKAQREIALGEGRCTIGRVAGNSVTLEDREVSKFHAEIVPDGAGFLLCDLGSSNGTLVNGARVQRHVLREGDRVHFGQHHYLFTMGHASAAVAILPGSPVDKTSVLATLPAGEMLPASKLKDVEAIKRNYERIRIAFDAVQRLLATPDLRALCEQILDVTFKLLPAESGAIFLFDEKQQLVPWAHRGNNDDGQRVIVSRTIVDQVLSSRAAVLASDALTDARFGGARSIVMSGLRSILCVPLIAGDEVYGILHVGNGKEVGAFRPNDLELIFGIGTGAGVALSNSFLVHRLAAEARARESLGRFLSPVLVDRVMQQKLDLKRVGQELDVTVMFADIRGFTPLTERSRAADIVGLLNEYFDQMVEIIFRHGGVLDKFIGDAIMAVWGAPVPQKDDATRALACAHEMQDTLESLNAFRRDRGDEPIEIGIGFASGRCISGAIGARRRMEYTVIGDAVNLASRLAGLARGGQILCDEATHRLSGAPKTARALPPTQVKGKSKPVSVFEHRAKGTA